MRSSLSAKDFLKTAVDSATKAFSNEGLDAYDRVLSMKFRVAATMLQDLPCAVEWLTGSSRGIFCTIWWVQHKETCEKRREALIGAVVSIIRILWEYLHLWSKGGEFLRN